MKMAKVENGVVVQVADSSELFEFKYEIPTAEQMRDRGLMHVNLFREHDPFTQRLVQADPVVEGDWVYLVEVQDLTAEEIQSQKNVAMNKLRQDRNRLLSETDWTQLADATVDKQVWAAYRQALRDFPATVEDARLPVTWPEYPIPVVQPN